ncbi:MAG: hypothetical protein A2Y15_08600 [Clostridiales bacterium GWF2_36_10]|nr:MAG: hypothetical protein A2Y15_08600 [Clostridiales bacterium GWF2_36_10]HAN20403.1 hypothetical protein [Clostridiales bacterium]
MANMNQLFSDFDGKIKLTNAKTNSLKTSRDALRKDIRDWFFEKNKDIPTFCWQGSFAMKTTVNPLSGGEYDLDDGVYLEGYSDIDKESWPTTSTVHGWIKSSVEDRTSDLPIDKDTCIRVTYTSGYHIDLPIYIIKNDIAYLAHKTKGWIESDPKAFKKWFVDHVSDKGEQLRRIVRYLKSWKDYKNVSLKGIEITILVTNHFDKYDNRDDKSLKNTISSIISSLEESFSCYKPVIPNEDLFEGFSDTKKTSINDSLKNALNKLEKAINEPNEKKASEYLQSIFGERFPTGNDSITSNSSYEITNAPGVLKNDGRSGK